MEDYISLLGLPTGGALRASVGLASNVEDAQRFAAFVAATYQDRVVGTGSLPPRQAC